MIIQFHLLKQSPDIGWFLLQWWYFPQVNPFHTLPHSTDGFGRIPTQYLHDLLFYFIFLQLLEFLKRILVVHYLLTPWNGFLMGEILHWGLFGIKSFLISLNHNSWSTFKEMTYTASDGNLKLYVCEINLSHKKLYGNFWIWALQSFNPWLYLKCHFSSLLRVIWRGPEDKVYWLIMIRLNYYLHSTFLLQLL